MLAKMVYFRVYCISGQIWRDEGIECPSLFWSSIFFPPCYANLSARYGVLSLNASLNLLQPGVATCVGLTLSSSLGYVSAKNCHLCLLHTLCLFPTIL